MTIVRNLLLSSIIFLVWPAAPSVHAYTQEECVACHAEDSNESTLHMSIQEFQNSIHGSELSCVDCHTSITGKDHEKGKTAVPVDCNQCHEQENMHGSGAEANNRPKCYSCHGKHSILKKDAYNSSVNRTRLKYTCSECHPVECGEGGYWSWLPSLRIKSHEKQDFSIAYSRFNCIGCHQGQAVHGQEQMSDGSDCHVCHMKLKAYGAVAGYIHPIAHKEDHPAIFLAAIISPVFLLIMLLGLAGYAWARPDGKPKGRKG